MKASKYEPLGKFLINLAASGQNKITLSFKEVEGILGFTLPDSAYDKNKSWWGNDCGGSHPQAKAWLDAKWRVVGKNMENKRVTFKVESAFGKTEDTKQPNRYVEKKSISSRKIGISNILVFSPCCATKCDKRTPDDKNERKPQDYLDDKELVDRLTSKRKGILCDPKGEKTTYAWDLYVWTGRAYGDLRCSGNVERVKKLLAENKLQWFFLSGGYGVVHALEKVNDYQATFNRSTEYQKHILFTGNIWRGGALLSQLCDAIVQKFNPSCVYIFGSRDYTAFIRKAYFWGKRGEDSVKMFESTGRNGSYWLSERLDELAEAILTGKLNGFNKNHPGKFCKQ